MAAPVKGGKKKSTPINNRDPPSVWRQERGGGRKSKRGPLGEKLLKRRLSRQQGIRREELSQSRSNAKHPMW